MIQRSTMRMCPLSSYNETLNELAQLWEHLKIQDFKICNIHGVSTACLNISNRRNLDGLKAWCLRHVFELLKPCFKSTVCNKSVMQQAVQKPFCNFFRQQLLLCGRIARAPEMRIRYALLRSCTLRSTTDKYACVHRRS